MAVELPCLLSCDLTCCQVRMTVGVVRLHRETVLIDVAGMNREDTQTEYSPVATGQSIFGRDAWDVPDAWIRRKGKTGWDYGKVSVPGYVT